MAIQYLGTVHGGWLLALLDSALGCAVQIVQPGVCGITTLDLHVWFVVVEQVEYKPKCESRALLTIPG
jgi:acyl-coenzyme A thioesterase PaaI-like protein